MKTIAFVGLSILPVTLSLWAQDESFTTLRNADVLEQAETPPLAPQENLPSRRVTDHPTEAPTIPHAINGYAVTKDFNQCLVCHDKEVAPALKAPDVPVSHFTNRDGEYLVNLSPRRYFCTQCHVPQTTAD